MRADIVPGATFPDYELSDHTGGPGACAYTFSKCQFRLTALRQRSIQCSVDFLIALGALASFSSFHFSLAAPTAVNLRVLFGERFLDFLIGSLCICFYAGFTRDALAGQRRREPLRKV